MAITFAELGNSLPSTLKLEDTGARYVRIYHTTDAYTSPTSQAHRNELVSRRTMDRAKALSIVANSGLTMTTDWFVTDSYKDSKSGTWKPNWSIYIERERIVGTGPSIPSNSKVDAAQLTDDELITTALERDQMAALRIIGNSDQLNLVSRARLRMMLNS